MSLLVLNTRPQGKQTKLNELLLDKGVLSIEFPMLTIDMTRAYEELSQLKLSFTTEDWIVFTSDNGAKSLSGLYANAEELKLPRTAVVGKKTGEIAEKLGFRVEFVSKVSNTDSFAYEFMSLLETQRPKTNNPKIYLFRANTANPILPILLSASNYSVESYVAYHSVKPHMNKTDISRLGAALGLFYVPKQVPVVDAIILTSSRAIRNLIEILQEASTRWRRDWLFQLQSIPVCVIGPKTEQTALEYGFRRVVEARDTDDVALANAVFSIFTKP